MSTYLDTYLDIDHELSLRREQRESVKGKDTPFCVEFRYAGGTTHRQYFATLKDARKAKDSSCTYGVYGNPVTRRPRSQKILVKGPRGGWSPFISQESKP